jgi:hypothetical protein
MGFKVLEVNASMGRSGKQVRKLIQGILTEAVGSVQPTSLYQATGSD